MKNIVDALEAIKVNLADNRKPRRIVPTSRANVWCSRCGDSGHFASECFKGPQRQVHLVDPEIGVYYSKFGRRIRTGNKSDFSSSDSLRKR